MSSPQLPALLDALPQRPSADELARFLHVSPRTVRRWIAAGTAPRPVLLALYWETWHGRRTADLDAWNTAELHRQQADALRRERDALKRELARVLAAGDFGSANAPTMRGDLPARLVR